MSSQLQVVPITRDVGRAFIWEHHSHHHPPNQAIIWCGVAFNGELVCVGCLERPKAMKTCLASPTAGEITRIASDGSQKNAASKCIAAISRAALALGYTRLISFTLIGEAGTSYRAAGWRVTGFTEPNRSWSASNRARAPAVQPGKKARWEFGPEALPLDEETDLLVQEMVGKVELQPRQEVLPLFTGCPKVVGEGKT